jgi:hypothetical protein
MKVVRINGADEIPLGVNQAYGVIQQASKNIWYSDNAVIPAFSLAAIANDYMAKHPVSINPDIRHTCNGVGSGVGLYQWIMTGPFEDTANPGQTFRWEENQFICRYGANHNTLPACPLSDCKKDENGNVGECTECQSGLVY